MHAKHADSERPNDLSRLVIRRAFTVLDTLGAEFLAKVYNNALAYELHDSGCRLYGNAASAYTIRTRWPASKAWTYWSRT